jgi:hypothetical protein
MRLILLRELRDALDALPHGALLTAGGLGLEQGDQHCVLGALGMYRGMCMAGIDTKRNRTQNLAVAFGISAQDVNNLLTEDGDDQLESPGGRFSRMRQWIEMQIEAESQRS